MKTDAIPYTFSVEQLIMVRGEVAELLKQHWAELCADPLRAQLDPDWPAYHAMEDAGQLEIMVARDSRAQICAYAAFFVRPHIHYKSFVVAANDVIFVRDDWRRPRFMADFVKFCESMIQARGDVHKITWHLKLSRDWGRLLTRAGYQSEEVTYTRALEKL